MISQLNPLARFGGVAALTLPLLFSVDWVSAVVALVGSVLAALLLGVNMRAVAKYALPLWLAIPVAGLSMLLYGAVDGEIYWQWWFITISENSVSLSIAAMLRVAAIGLPAIMFLHAIDPTELGNSLAQIAKLPAHFVLAAVASARLLTLSERDFGQLRRARRARGIQGDRLRRTFSMILGLFVMALRRGAKLATAMEARGFGRADSRTYVHPSVLKPADYCFMLGGLLLALLAIGIAITTGEYRFLGQ